MEAAIESFCLPVGLEFRYPRAFSSEVDPVCVKKTGKNKNLKHRSDSIGSEKAPASVRGEQAVHMGERAVVQEISI
jgi:hypothetical protein